MHAVDALPRTLAWRQTDARPVGLVRMLIGLASIGNALEHWAALERLLAPAVVRMPYFAWLPYPSQSVVPALIGLWLVAALLVMVGFRTRWAGTLLTAVLAYVLLLDQQLYSNHLYLNTLMVLLLTLADSGAHYSLDARFRGPRNKIAEWPILLIKAEVAIVYFYAALTKVNPSYLSGDVMANFVNSAALAAIPVGWPIGGLLAALAIGSVLVEFFLAFALWLAGWRWLALLAGLVLHLSIIFTGGSALGVPDIPFTVFALLVMSPYMLFFPWPPRRSVAG